MDEDEQRAFETSIAELTAREQADKKIVELRELIREGRTSEELLSSIPKECLVCIGDSTGFQPQDWMPEPLMRQAASNWYNALLLQQVEVARITGKDEEQTLLEIHSSMARVGILDRIRLREGLYGEVNPIDESPEE